MQHLSNDGSCYLGWLRCHPDGCDVPETGPEHRAMARHLLATAMSGDTTNRIAAAQVHALLALSAPEIVEEDHP